MTDDVESTKSKASRELVDEALGALDSKVLSRDDLRKLLEVAFESGRSGRKHIKRICKYCGGRFRAERASQEYCSEKCVRTMQIRRGIEREKRVYKLWTSGRYKTMNALADELGYSLSNIRHLIDAKEFRDKYLEGVSNVSTRAIMLTRTLDDVDRVDLLRKVDAGEIKPNQIKDCVKEMLDRAICPVCGKKFRKTTKAHVFCSPACRGWSKKGKKRFMGVCVVCGKEFIKTSNSQKFCLECRGKS
ncbi:hypothetical protein DRQ25_04745 [Candidatus Fermentibacteria bacterium]|nr:MAG: hypothetical protein DRQ25_04745 [Candidatus Fermentibacteria bacterium]